MHKMFFRKTIHGKEIHLAHDLTGTVNAENFCGFKPGTLMISDIRGHRASAVEGDPFEVRFTVIHRPEGFQIKYDETPNRRTNRLHRLRNGVIHRQRLRRRRIPKDVRVPLYRVKLFGFIGLEPIKE